ncbi:jg3463 [Pararge aegeria aegeria]|uniref:Jg3463 protein n=1 Tax=Pararge aegeria aegeria TaxID=348720 RepID=A0A8S4R8C4_9NEOP|nr:jg3463 [Pararge aegeria aegeria]
MHATAVYRAEIASPFFNAGKCVYASPSASEAALFPEGYVGVTGIRQPEYPLKPSDVPTRRLVTGTREHLRNRPHPSQRRLPGDLFKVSKLHQRRTRKYK